MKRKRSRQFFIALTIVFSAMVVFGVFMILSIQTNYRQSRELYNSLEQHLSFSDSFSLNLPEGETFTLPDDVVLPSVDFAALNEINANVIGWIFLPNTQINYPVVQGEDNTHYLNHLFDGRQNAAGAIFVDSHNSPNFQDRNTIIYGHHMRDGSMFAAIERYRSQYFFEENPWVFLLTPQGNYVIQLVAGYTTNVRSSAWFLDFTDDDDVEVWIGERRERSDFVSEAQIRPTDRFVTLSTCSWAFNDARYVVVGRLIPLG